MAHSVMNQTSKSSLFSIIGALIISHIVLLIVFVFFRFVDADEGFYLSAALQVAEGKLPYHDFFFPQMPYLSSVISLVAGHGWETLQYSRLLGIVPAILTLLLFARIVSLLSADRRVAAVAVAMYALSGPILAWHSPAKTYAWTDLFLLVAFWCLVRLKESRQKLWLPLAVMSIALAINFRLVLLAAIIPSGLVLWQTRERIVKWQILLSICLAIAVSLPTINLFFASPEQFMFNNLGFHLMRDPAMTFWPSIWQKITTCLSLAINPQITVMAVLFCLTLVLILREKLPIKSFSSYLHTPCGVSALFGAAIMLAYVTPSPMLQQYVVQSLPFFIIASLPALNFVLSTERIMSRWSNRGIVRTLSIIYILGLSPYLVIFLGAVRERDQAYRQENISALCTFVRDYPVPGPVLSEWSVVPALTVRASLADLEFVGFDYPLPVIDSAKRELHLPVNDDLRRALRNRIPSLYIVWNAPDSALQAVADSHYVAVKSFDKLVVYARRQYY